MNVIIKVSGLITVQKKKTPLLTHHRKTNSFLGPLRIEIPATLSPALIKTLSRQYSIGRLGGGGGGS